MKLSADSIGYINNKTYTSYHMHDSTSTVQFKSKGVANIVKAKSQHNEHTDSTPTQSGKVYKDKFE